MYEITYLEDYGKEVTRRYENEDIFVQAMNQMWPPFQDHYKVTSFTIDGMDQGYSGRIGGLYYFFLQMTQH